MAQKDAKKGATATADATAQADAQSNAEAKAEANEAVQDFKRRGQSAESRLKLALNDVLGFVDESVPEATVEASQEVKTAKSLLDSLGFKRRQSAAKRVAEIQAELKEIDVTAPDAQAQINALSKELGSLRRV